MQWILINGDVAMWQSVNMILIRYNQKFNNIIKYESQPVCIHKMCYLPTNHQILIIKCNKRDWNNV